jgi:hypothetical protein
VTTADTPVTVNVLANDSDPDGDELILLAVGSASEGQAAVVGDFISYTPAQGYIGSDSFIYYVTDNIGGISTATVSVEVKQSTAGSAQVAVSSTQLTVREGASAGYTITLGSQPSDSVIITVVLGDQLTANQLTADQLTIEPAAVTFTPANWSQPQTIQVTANADGVDEGEQQVTLLHSVQSDDSQYNNIGTPNVVVIIHDQQLTRLPFVH